MGLLALSRDDDEQDMAGGGRDGDGLPEMDGPCTRWLGRGFCAHHDTQSRLKFISGREHGKDTR
jgi:hypothetical protein